MSLTGKILASRRKDSSVGSSLPFELSIDSFDAREIRGDDSVATRKYNKDVREWANRQTGRLRMSVSQKIQEDIGLSESLKEKVYYTRGKGRIANRIGYSFLREGIYVHKGAGRGQGGLIGSSWIDKYGRRKSRHPDSAGKMDSRNRRAVRWFDKTIDRSLPQLADLVADFSATLQVDATNLLIDNE